MVVQEARRGWGLVVLCSATALVVGGMIGRFSLQPQGGMPIIVSTPPAAETPFSTSTPTPVRVYVCGAVQQPAVYTIPSGSIVQDAVTAAGGATSEADLEAINLALELQDQQRVYVPRRGEAPPPISSGDDPVTLLVNINTATATDLESLPGIGPVTAGHIIAYREANGPFGSIEEIQKVERIGPATFDRLRDLITIQ
jgi:competence protein ComEA